ncbi:NAD(P)/FAD-dependent oxidoreductase SCDLUD_002702 [Saccharomycodes ludwigii]|uniref:NAD(P)/FAD-dependent oxidoreductase n=1 Tax=Saccharomycodes ludwigii TaxID=36035 RepID=UPI001E8A86A5|nr:hypothetical protein SCDLUD_002702 [Saccharomycodes ludwigii]KAH3901216.1 hypothetical protein SCDLUD_002702 [Saccharomycodes ludwigii]
MLVRKTLGLGISFCRFASDYSHAVIGAGVVGLAVASELSKINGSSVLVIEKNKQFGMETSSRNSEVIHAGLYYPKDSLKGKLCIEGKNIIYNELKPRISGVDWIKCGKIIVAQTDYDDFVIENMYTKCKEELGVPVQLIPSNKMQYLEPSIVANRGGLLSPTTGIINSHSLMAYLESELKTNDGDIILNTEVLNMDYSSSSKEYTVLCKDVPSNEEIEITVDNVINCAGLYSDKVANMLLPLERHKRIYYGKGNYFKLNTSTVPPVRHLIYPIPPKNGKSLGTHLTIDPDYNIRFGPDMEYVNSPADYEVNTSNLKYAYEQIINYYPHISMDQLEPAYSGIRPKLQGPGEKGFEDYYIKEEEGFPGFINLMGIESPGLTSSIAIGRYIKSKYF